MSFIGMAWSLSPDTKMPPRPTADKSLSPAEDVRRIGMSALCANQPRNATLRLTWVSADVLPNAGFTHGRTTYALCGLLCSRSYGSGVTDSRRRRPFPLERWRRRLDQLTKLDSHPFRFGR